jgi:hypothetical protein
MILSHVNPSRWQLATPQRMAERDPIAKGPKSFGVLILNYEGSCVKDTSEVGDTRGIKYSERSNNISQISGCHTKSRVKLTVKNGGLTE